MQFGGPALLQAVYDVEDVNCWESKQAIVLDLRAPPQRFIRRSLDTSFEVSWIRRQT